MDKSKGQSPVEYPRHFNLTIFRGPTSTNPHGETQNEDNKGQQQDDYRHADCDGGDDEVEGVVDGLAVHIWGLLLFSVHFCQLYNPSPHRVKTDADICLLLPANVTETVL